MLSLAKTGAGPFGLVGAHDDLLRSKMMIDDDARSQNGGSEIACWKLLIFQNFNLNTDTFQLEHTSSPVSIPLAGLHGSTALDPGEISTERSIFYLKNNSPQVGVCPKHSKQTYTGF